MRQMKKTGDKDSFFNKIMQPRVLFFVAGFFIALSFLAPALFTRPWGLFTFNVKTSYIGETFGIMNPFIAIAAAIITYAAFWAQFKANQDMLENNRIQHETDLAKQEEENNRNQKQLAINRFYEMLQIHRDNVKELEWFVVEGDGSITRMNGRQIFAYHLLEYNLIYSILDTLYPTQDPEKDDATKAKKAYEIFYKGANDAQLSLVKRANINKAIASCASPQYFIGKVAGILGISNDTAKEHAKLVDSLKDIYANKNFFIAQPPFRGHFEELNNYYRHLFLTVKTVVKVEKKYLEYNEKRDLLRILRAQLTNTEQVMLCYNWFSGNGRQWEEKDGNHFFTQYRMVHNITPNKLLPFRTPMNNDAAAYKNFMAHFGKSESIKMFCNRQDPMFEFEDWDGYPKFNYN